MRETLSPLTRFVLWDYDRGSWAYDVLCVLMLVLVFLIPPAWLGDPMVVRP